MVKIKFIVHRVQNTTVSKEVTLEDKTVVSAAVPCLEVELVSTSQGGGTYTHRFIGQDVEAAKKLFVQDATVSGDFQ